MFPFLIDLAPRKALFRGHLETLLTMKSEFLKALTKLALLLILAVAACSEEVMLPVQQPSTVDSAKVHASSTTPVACSTCKYVVPVEAMHVDGLALGIKPGDVICFNAAIKYFHSINFKNIVGTADNPVIIKNCGGTAILTADGRPFNVKMSYSKYFRFTGGDTPGVYGIKMSGPSGSGLVLADKSTNFEVDHIEVRYVGFAGVIAKTDPTCDNSTNRGYFTMRNISIHDNYMHHTGGEGFYIGHSFYGGYKLDCGVKLPHTIEGSRIFNNKTKYTGWDGIQVGCATKDTEIYNNVVEYPGTKLITNQGNGIIISDGTGGKCYGNLIKGGVGNGMTVFGRGENDIYNNIIIDAGKSGIFVDERTELLGSGYRILNNTIIRPKDVGIRIYSDLVPMNIVRNNIVASPGAYSTLGATAYLLKLRTVVIDASNNYNTQSITSVKFVDPGTGNYRLQTGSPAIDKGKSISTYNVLKDFYGGARLKGTYYDIGASEF
jgi:hypothetical protein